MLISAVLHVGVPLGEDVTERDARLRFHLEARAAAAQHRGDLPCGVLVVLLGHARPHESRDFGVGLDWKRVETVHTRAVTKKHVHERHVGGEDGLREHAILDEGLGAFLTVLRTNCPQERVGYGGAVRVLGSERALGLERVREFHERVARAADHLCSARHEERGPLGVVVEHRVLEQAREPACRVHVGSMREEDARRSRPRRADDGELLAVAVDVRALLHQHLGDPRVTALRGLAERRRLLVHLVGIGAAGEQLGNCGLVAMTARGNERGASAGGGKEREGEGEGGSRMGQGGSV